MLSVISNIDYNILYFFKLPSKSIISLLFWISISNPDWKLGLKRGAGTVAPLRASIITCIRRCLVFYEKSSEDQKRSSCPQTSIVYQPSTPWERFSHPGRCGHPWLKNPGLNVKISQAKSPLSCVYVKNNQNRWGLIQRN